MRQDPGRDPGGVSERAGGPGVHVVTVNDYLARRDATGWGACTVSRYVHRGDQLVGRHGSDSASLWSIQGMRRYRCRFPHLRPVTCKAYACDITYGTNNEFGFDYLRDNMAFAAGKRSAVFRRRRRGRLDPDRRGAHAADHLRPAETVQTCTEVNDIPAQLVRQDPRNDEGRPVSARRHLGRRKGPPGVPDRATRVTQVEQMLSDAVAAEGRACTTRRTSC